MKIYVEKVLKYTQADAIPAPTYLNPGQFVPGKTGTAVEVTVRALTESEADIAAWESAVGKILHVYEPDLNPQAVDDDWFVRCEAVYPNDERHLTSGREYERCCFPSLNSPQWHLHDDEHASATYGWGGREVWVKKEERRNG